ncbi:hypothetical protein [Candidatus Nitrotoga arctica]|nr:hypothetical protein [Candidatus Nitrotoga arctica]
MMNPSAHEISKAPAKIHNVVDIDGRKASVLFQDDQCFDIILRLPEKLCCHIKVLKQLPIRLPSNETVVHLRSNF